nr:hypothetical protein [Pelagicoccus enzymogenes]
MSCYRDDSVYLRRDSKGVLHYDAFDVATKSRFKIVWTEVHATVFKINI